MPLDERAIATAARQMRSAGIRCVGVSAIFPPLYSAMELRAAEIVRQEVPDVAITLSHELGRIGLLERENVALLNAALAPLAAHTVRAFELALAETRIAAPLYITQNDGTVIRAELAARFPVLSFASGPTNSMRGAAFLTGVMDALLVDVEDLPIAYLPGGRCGCVPASWARLHRTELGRSGSLFVWPLPVCGHHEGTVGSGQRLDRGVWERCPPCGGTIGDSVNSLVRQGASQRRRRLLTPHWHGRRTQLVVDVKNTAQHQPL